MKSTFEFDITRTTQEVDFSFLPSCGWRPWTRCVLRGLMSIKKQCQG